MEIIRSHISVTTTTAHESRKGDNAARRKEIVRVKMNIQTCASIRSSIGSRFLGIHASANSPMLACEPHIRRDGLESLERDRERDVSRTALWAEKNRARYECSHHVATVLHDFLIEYVNHVDTAAIICRVAHRWHNRRVRYRQ